MRRPWTFLLFWTVVIAVLLFVEIAELTRLFSINLLAAISNPVTFALALIFVTIVALVGAIFIGIYVSQRLLSPRGFSPFEEEMLKMRAEVMEIRRQLREIRVPLSGANGPTRSEAAIDSDPPERQG
jgi:membrane protein implicated in regulation of membrane protease activity